MMKERSVDLLILFLNVVAILVLVAVLSIMMNSANADTGIATTQPTNFELTTINNFKHTA